MTRNEIIVLRDKTFESICPMFFQKVDKKGNAKLDEKIYDTFTSLHETLWRQLDSPANQEPKLPSSGFDG